ncbi:amino acid adenylation domain-containing protein [Eubacterium sp.]|uniref:amino acid adenylation domain-containing protein n=1 Tax=Eubacterium sp. TaxID=142586 RepID=UPI002FC6245A
MTIYYPCTHPQKRILYTELIGDAINLFSFAGMMVFETTDVGRIQAAVIKAMEETPNFSLRFRMDDAGTLFFYKGPEGVAIEDVENGHPAIHTFDTLYDCPLYHFCIYPTDQGYTLQMSFHHSLCDGTGLDLFAQKVWSWYEKGVSLSTVDRPYEEYADCEKRYMASEACTADREYWHSTLADAGDLASEPRDAEGDYTRGYAVFKLPEALTQQIGEFLDQQATHYSPFLFALTAMGMFLAKRNGKPGILLNLGEGGRRHLEDFSQTTGMFTSLVPLKLSFPEDEDLTGCLKVTRGAFKAALGHSRYPYDILSQEMLEAGVDIGASAAASIVSNAYNPASHLARTLYAGQAAENLTIRINPDVPGQDALVSFGLEYQRACYTEAQVQKIGEAFLDYMTALVEEPAVAFGKGSIDPAVMLSAEKANEQPVADPEEITRLDSFNATERPYDATATLVDLFRNQAQKTPEALCVVYKNHRYTYAQVDRLSDNLARHIAGQGLDTGDVVSILIPRCEYMAIASLGVLKAGCAYQPLDPDYPRERLSFMMTDARAKLLITDATLRERVPDYTGAVLTTDAIPGLPGDGPLPGGPAAEDLYILLYTSGSTGTPKGCMLRHENMVNFCHWYHRYYGLTDADRVAAYASYGFDASMMDTWPALTRGAAMYIVPEEIRLDLLALNDCFEENGITIAFITTQVGRQFATCIEKTSLRHLSVGGEALVPCEPPVGYHLHNLYGPTECTILATASEVTALYEKSVPIGGPIDNTKLYVVDGKMRRVPVGVPGELCIAGVLVCGGYLGRPELTAEKFIPNPFDTDPAYARLYRTGDVVKWLSDGRIQFVGREDGQVKIRGFRIELTEIEQKIRDYPGIKDTTVIACDEEESGKYVAAYVVSDTPVSIPDLNAFIAAEKPAYMVPAVTMQIDTIPLTPNMKVDQRALPVPKRVFEDMTLPRTPLQEKIHSLLAEVVGSSAFGIDTDIYEAGLTSIGAVKLGVVFSKAFGVKMNTQAFKKYNTVEKLETYIDIAGSVTTAAQDRPQQDTYPLTQTQMGIYLESQRDPQSCMYNIPPVLYLFLRRGKGGFKAFDSGGDSSL